MSHISSEAARLKLDETHISEMLADAALSFALFGLMAEDQMIATRLGSLGSKIPKKAAS